jgi:hypothetical protein
VAFCISLAPPNLGLLGLLFLFWFFCVPNLKFFSILSHSQH